MENCLPLEKELNRRKFDKCKKDHSYRLWLDSDNGKAICGDCGTFIYKRKKNWQDLISFFKNKFGKICLSCLVEKANENRKVILKIDSPNLLINYDHNLFLNHNHNLWCDIQRNIIYWKYRLKC